MLMMNVFPDSFPFSPPHVHHSFPLLHRKRFMLNSIKKSYTLLLLITCLTSQYYFLNTFHSNLSIRTHYFHRCRTKRVREYQISIHVISSLNLFSHAYQDIRIIYFNFFHISLSLTHSL